MTPTTLGRYRLDQQVGQGGMAVVWKGFDTQLLRTVAVKVLHPHLLQREEIRRRFSREAHAVARLHHPAILDIYDFSGPGVAPAYLVTEFIPGRSLREFADAHPFDPPELAAACVLTLAEALEHAHAANVVHRDLKPENVMVRDDGMVKLTDFGIAALLDPDEKFTATGAILGSPAHLAPETIEGKPVDTRSDLFSLGTVLYWLACGQLPFQAKTPAALLRQILEGKAPDPRSVRPAVSDGLAQVIAHLLERDPEKRTQTAAQTKRELLEVLNEAGIDDPAKELAAFVSGKPPEATAADLRRRLVARSLSLGEQAMRARRTGAALSAFARALALDPKNGPAAIRVEQIRNRARAIKRAKVAGMVLAMVAAIALLVVQVAQGRRLHREELARQTEIDGKAALLTQTISAKPAPAPAAIPPASLPIPASAKIAEEAGDLAAQKKRLARIRDFDATPRPPRVARGPLVDATLTVHWVWAHVTVDGDDLGESQTFTRRLASGPHRVTVSHLCCLDSTQTIDVEPGQVRYALEPGKPKPARLAVSGAPPDAPVLIDGVAMGPSATLETHELPMTDRPSREVFLSVGDRGAKVTLQAGRTNQIDFLKLVPSAAP